MNPTTANEPRNIAADSAQKAIAETPINIAHSDLFSQLAHLDEVIYLLASRLEPVRNVYPALAEKDPGEPTAPKSVHRQLIETAADRVRNARQVLETITSELEV